MNWKTKDILKVLAIITLFILFLGFLSKLLGVISWVAAAFLITILFSPLVDWIQGWIPRKNRGVAVLFTFIFVLIILGVLTVIIFSPLIKEFGNLSGQVSILSENLKANTELNDLLQKAGGQKVQIGQINIASYLKDGLSVLTTSVKNLISNVSYGIFTMITIITLTFFMLLDTKGAIESLGAIIPKKYHSVYLKLNKDLFTLVSKYFFGVLIVAFIAGLAVTVPLFLTHAPYILALAATIAIFDLVPMIGATLGTIIVDIILVLSGNIQAAIVMTIFIIIYQQVENNIIIPLVQKQTIKMRPLSILIALLVGGAVGGIIGTLLAIPAIAFIKVVYETLKSEGLISKKIEEEVA